MSRRWVVNASPLILLSKAGRLDLLTGQVDELLIPEGVVREVRVKPDEDGALDELVALPRVRVESGAAIPREVEAWDLGRGETEVLALAIARRCRAVVDDLEARRCAQALELGVIGTLGVVLRAKRVGLISTARPVLDQLRQVGLYVKDDLVERGLAHLGE